MGTKKESDSDRRRREDAEDLAVYRARSSEPSLDFETVLDVLARRDAAER